MAMYQLRIVISHGYTNMVGADVHEHRADIPAPTLSLVEGLALTLCSLYFQHYKEHPKCELNGSLIRLSYLNLPSVEIIRYHGSSDTPLTATKAETKKPA